MPTIKQYLDKAERAESGKMSYRNPWQLVCEYIHQRRADFTSTREPGAFITANLWTDDPTQMAETAASALLGYMWPVGAKSFKLEGAHPLFEKDKTMSEFWSDATKTIQDEMDDPEAGLAVGMDELMLDVLCIGTAAILTEERNFDESNLGALSFDMWSVLEFSLDENAAGMANQFYRYRTFTVAQLIEKYGEENVSKKSLDAFKKGQTDQLVKVLHVIAPRDLKDRKPTSKAAKDMPIASVHIEVEAQKMLRNGGYPEMPVACLRLAKRINEKYGRGRGMNALPSIMMLNQIWEDLALASEKKLDPSLYVLNDTVSGNGVLDTSAGSINVLRVSKAQSNIPPVGKLYDIEDTGDVTALIEKLQNSIANHFYIDRLINMNNEREMTYGEALMRNAIRQSTLRALVERAKQELFEPLITRCFNILLRRGKFGYMPGDPVARAAEKAGRKVKMPPQKLLDAMDAGGDLYRIQYMTPAARDQKVEEGQAIVETAEVALKLAQFDENIADVFDAEATLIKYAEIRGAPRDIIRKEAEIKSIRSKRAEAAQAEQAAMLAKAGGGLARDAAAAQNMTMT